MRKIAISQNCISTLNLFIDFTLSDPDLIGFHCRCHFAREHVIIKYIHELKDLNNSTTKETQND